MCVAAIAWQAHPLWQLVVAGNRDEYHERPAVPLCKWPSGILAGLDLQAGGTWLGVATGRFALVTNRRAEGHPLPGMATRGNLVTDYLEGKPPGDGAAMNPFNLVTVGPDGARLLTNFPAPEQRELPSGVHTLSNGGLDEQWFKEKQLAGALELWPLTSNDPEDLLDRLRNPAPDPDEPESRYSSVFIIDPEYGTRCSTVVMVDRMGRGVIIERSFDWLGREAGTVKLEFSW